MPDFNAIPNNPFTNFQVPVPKTGPTWEEADRAYVPMTPEDHMNMYQTFERVNNLKELNRIMYMQNQEDMETRQAMGELAKQLPPGDIQTQLMALPGLNVPSMSQLAGLRGKNSLAQMLGNIQSQQYAGPLNEAAMFKDYAAGQKSLNTGQELKFADFGMDPETGVATQRIKEGPYAGMLVANKGAVDAAHTKGQDISKNFGKEVPGHPEFVQYTGVPVQSRQPFQLYEMLKNSPDKWDQATFDQAAGMAAMLNQQPRYTGMGGSLFQGAWNTRYMQYLKNHGLTPGVLAVMRSALHSQEKSLDKITLKRQMLAGFKDRLDGQINQLYDLYNTLADYKTPDRLGIRKIDETVRNMKIRLLGSGKEVVVGTYLKDISMNMNKIASGNPESIAMLPQGQQEQWDRLHDPNLSLQEMKHILDSGKNISQTAMDGLDHSLDLVLRAIQYPTFTAQQANTFFGRPLDAPTSGRYYPETNWQEGTPQQGFSYSPREPAGETKDFQGWLDADPEYSKKPQPAPPASPSGTSPDRQKFDLSIYDNDFTQAAKMAGIPGEVETLKRMARAESMGDPKAVGPRLPDGSNALGLMQFTPKTAKLYGLKDPTNPKESIYAAARYMADLIKKYQVFGMDAARVLALMEYGGRVRKGDLEYYSKILRGVGWKMTVKESQKNKSVPTRVGIRQGNNPPVASFQVTED